MSDATPPMARPFTPGSLAKEWGCSERLIRNLIAAGELQAFKLGEKLLRIPAAAAEDYVRRRTVSASKEPAVVDPEADKRNERMASRLARMVAQKRQR